MNRAILRMLGHELQKALHCLALTGLIFIVLFSNLKSSKKWFNLLKDINARMLQNKRRTLLIVFASRLGTRNNPLTHPISSRGLFRTLPPDFNWPPPTNPRDVQINHFACIDRISYLVKNQTRQLLPQQALADSLSLSPSLYMHDGTGRPQAVPR